MDPERLWVLILLEAASPISKGRGEEGTGREEECDKGTRACDSPNLIKVMVPFRFGVNIELMLPKDATRDEIEKFSENIKNIPV